MTVRLPDEAERDIEHIADRIASDHPARAISFVQELIAKCMDLTQFPERFPLVRRYEKYGIRRRVHGKYLIFYAAEADGEVAVLHVLHGAMDYEDMLFPS